MGFFEGLFICGDVVFEVGNDSFVSNLGFTVFLG